MKNVLHDMRKTAGYDTQEKLSAELGVERCTIAKWEAGRAYPRPTTLVKLARVLRVSEGDIIEAITEAKKENRPA